MPRDSYYVQAISDNDEYARMALAQAGESNTAPPLHTWSQTVELLTRIHESVERNTHATIMAAGPKNKVAAPKPFPRPRTAFDRIRDEQRKESHDAVAASFLGSRFKPT